MVKASKMRGGGVARAVRKTAQQKEAAENKPVVAGTAESKPSPAASAPKPVAAATVPSPAASAKAPTPVPEPAPVVNAYNDVVDIFEVSAAAPQEKAPVKTAAKPPVKAAEPDDVVDFEITVAKEKAPAKTPAKAAEPDDVVDFEIIAVREDAPGKTPEKTAEADDIVDIELAAAVEMKPEKKASVPVAPAKDPPTVALKPAKAEQPKGAQAKDGGHSSADEDATDAVDIDDMLASIDKKIDAQEPVGLSKSDVDKDIADLDEIMKTGEKTEKDQPDLK
jgi:hypothetical protein